jgi:hypothetical protein
MPYLLRLSIACIFSAACYSQITIDQKIADLESLAAQFAKHYAPYEWKRDTIGADALNLTPWIVKMRATRDDLGYYEVMAEYVASFQDAHSVYTVPSTFNASLGFTVDIYDGKVLVDSINRTALPLAIYAFAIGDELISIDGTPVNTLINSLLKYSGSANPISARRVTAGRLVARSQSRIPRAVEVGENASAVFRRQNGELVTYTIPWIKTGLPLRSVGPVPSPKSARSTTMDSESILPSYMEPLSRLWNSSIPDQNTVLGQGQRNPIFSPPPDFNQRLGRAQADVFVSGTYEAGGYRIGFIRIPNMSPANFVFALSQFEAEIRFFEQNTDGLVIDVMRNPGGAVFYGNNLLQYVIPERFRTLGYEIRATSSWVTDFAILIETAKVQNAPSWIIELLEAITRDITTANREFRGRTGPLPVDALTLDREPTRDERGNRIAYTKPLMVLIDEFSASGGDAFPATIQDNRRGLLFGMRTMGAGGTVSTHSAGVYGEGSTTLTDSLMNRRDAVVADGYPMAPYVENIGVHPDFKVDYMTTENLLRNGRPFVDAFTAAIVEHITRSR